LHGEVVTLISFAVYRIHLINFCDGNIPFANWTSNQIKFIVTD